MTKTDKKEQSMSCATPSERYKDYSPWNLLIRPRHPTHPLTLIRLDPHPNLELPPANVRAEGIPRTIPPTGSIHLGIHSTEDSSDSTLHSSRQPT
ncbi:hypothetical protein GIB67_026686, partial [Kingdonia uniflora]